MVCTSKRQVLLFSLDTTGEDTKVLCEALQSNKWDVTQVNTFALAKDKLKERSFNIGIIILDQQVSADLPHKLQDFLSIQSHINWIMILPEDLETELDIASDIEAIISQYCFDFHHSPVQLDLFLPVLGHANGMAEIARHPFKISSSDYAEFGIIGTSEPMTKLFRQIRKVCSLDVPVLISGETGTGKELIANAIHYHSPRADSELAVIDCGSLTESLIQAELFGYEKGAFTGANERRLGRIESSNGGTLFLDEIGDLPLSQQANLLRFLQEKTIVRLGGHKEIKLNVRVVAATNIDLKEAVTKGKFREDLYYRLKVLHLKVPPLRERGDDIELLCRYYLQSGLSMNNVRAKGLSSQALQVIRNYDWQGNVRELANTINRAQIMAEGRLITPTDLELEKRNNNNRDQTHTLEESRADAERSAIEDGLRKNKNNISQAADSLGVSRVTLYRLINKYRVEV